VGLTIPFLVTVFDNTQSGAAVANDVLLHSAADGLPFGGTGRSGCECLVFQSSASINELFGIQMDITLESTVLIRLLTPELLLILPHCTFDIPFVF
jgi:acyl-CoA reductase-like NAD-dependent aldehyde dehydrogenase